MNKNTFQEYALAKKEEKRIKALLDELRPQVVAEMEAVGADKVPSEFGTFTLIPKSIWKYSPAVDAAEKKVDELKEQEKATGVAHSDVRYDLIFKDVKKDA